MIGIGSIPLSITAMIYIFTNFPTFRYVDAENLKQDNLWFERQKIQDERQKQIDIKLDFLVQNIGKNNEQIRKNRDLLEDEIKRDRDRVERKGG